MEGNVFAGPAAENQAEYDVRIESLHCGATVTGNFYFSTFETEGNIAADPLFCDEVAGDYTIAQESPCGSNNSPEACGLMGALPVACSRTPTAHSTWGRVRALFRKRVPSYASATAALPSDPSGDRFDS